MFNRLRSLIAKELIQFSQDRLLLLFTIFGPLAQLLLIGGGVGEGVNNVPVALIDRDHSELSREVSYALDNTQELAITYYVDTFEEASTLIDAGDVGVLVVVPEGFAMDTLSGKSPAIQLVIDGSSVKVAGEAQSAAQGAIESLGWNVALASTGDLGLAQGIDLRQEALYNQTLDDKPYQVTASLAFVIFEVAALAAVMSIVREREIGTLEQVSITPVTKGEFIAGKAISPIIIGLVNFLILFSVVYLFFDVPMRGSLPLLILMTLLYLISEVSFSLMISAVSHTQQQAITIVFVYLMLALTMSGYMVPISRLPTVFQWAASALPIRHYMSIVRGVMLKGAGFSALWPNIAALLALDVVVVSVTVIVMRRLNR